VKDNHESLELVAKFDGIRDRLLAIAKDGNHDYGPIKSNDLSKLWVDLQHFMEVRYEGVVQEDREFVHTFRRKRKGCDRPMALWRAIVVVVVLLGCGYMSLVDRQQTCTHM